MRRRTVLTTLTTTATLIAAAAMLWACRDVTPPPLASPSRNAADRHHSSLGRNLEPGSQGRAIACTKREEQHGHARIGRGGGRITLGNNALIIPPGALHDAVDITATVPADTIAEIQLQPHGLQFESPVYLVFDATGCAIATDDDEVPVAYVDDAGTILEWLEGHVSPSGRTVVAAIHHFSGYILAF